LCRPNVAPFLVATPLQDKQEEKAPKESEKSEKSGPNFSGDWVLLRVEGWESLIRFPSQVPKEEEMRRIER
jgi:phosphomannomutase